MSTSSQTCLDFTTDSSYILADFQFNAAICVVNNSCVGGGGTSGFALLFNDITVARVKAEGASENMPTTATQRLVIPPFTNVKITVLSDSGDTSFQSTVNLTGRVYEHLPVRN